MDSLLPATSSNFASLPSPTEGRGAQAFGEFLRTARERRGLTIQQISHETKIPWRHLDALERGNLGAVPGGVYRRGEIRAYAHVVGLDEKVALAQLERALQVPAATEQIRPVNRPAPVKMPARRTTLFAIGVLAGVAIGIVMIDRGAGVAVDDSLPTVPPLVEGQAAPTTMVDQRSDAGAANTDVVASDARPASMEVSQPERPVPTSEKAPDPPPAQSDPTALQPPPIVSTNPDGELVVSSDPPGARVTVNGIGYGVTPVTIRYLPFGDARVRVAHDGYTTEEHVVRVDPRRATAAIHVLMNSSQ
jgi:cytoskeletal protein RodZ